MNILGKTTIHPFFFYTGKIIGYIIWALFILAVCNIYVFSLQQVLVLKLFAQCLSVLGLLITILSLINLGSAVRLGLPTEKTTLKSSGLYRFSRNPMYLGFNLILIAAIVYLGNAWVALAGAYSLSVYHFIILGEEKFLKQRFGKQYISYMKKVRRYF